MAPKLLLVTTVNWPSSARLAGAFAGTGATVEAVCPNGHVMIGSRFVSERHRYTAWEPLTSLARAIEEAQPDLVVPCDDRAVSQLLRLSGQFDVIAHSLGAPENYSTLLARGPFIAAARALGLEAPETIVVPGEQFLDIALARVGLPCVMKADGSWGGDGVAVIRDRGEAYENFYRFSEPPSRLRSLARAMKRRDVHFLREMVRPRPMTVCVQRFVPGMPATSAFACWNGRVLAAIHLDVLETSHAAGPASVLRRVDCPAMDKAAVRIAERFGLSGLHGLDFMRDAQGLPHLIESNPRATQAAALVLGAGGDLTAALVGCLSPAPRAVRPAMTENPVIALFPQEWRRNPASGWLQSAYLDVPWDDPAVLRACLEPGEPNPERRAVSRVESFVLASGKARMGSGN
jgi:predicted ATP-grasp superfamily ATP-dependent carboligase